MYLGSFIADLFDGMAARKFNQCSEFGGLLDMITDRCSTLGLFFVLYGEYGYEANDDFTGGCFKLVSLLTQNCSLLISLQLYYKKINISVLMICISNLFC
jgi:phosphatidylglycerophosphate synthase